MEKTQIPSQRSPWDVVIIGSGPAGLTAAIYTTRATLSTLILGGSRWGGQLMLTTEVENFPGFPQGIQGPQLMLSMRQQAERLGASFIETDVSQVDFHSRPFTLKTDQETIQTKSVIIAAGANSLWLNVPGEQQLIGRGVSSCAPCDAAFFKDKHVAVIGGGDSAMEEALVLTKFASEVSIFHRRDAFRASQIMQDRVLADKKIKVFWDTQVIEIQGDQKVTGIKLKTALNTKQYQALKAKKPNHEPVQILKQDQESLFWQMPIDGVFVAIGHSPNTKIFSGQVDLDEKNYIKVTNGTHTNIEGVFVAGDVQDYRYRQAITAAGFGCMAAMDVEKWLEERH